MTCRRWDKWICLENFDQNTSRKIVYRRRRCKEILKGIMKIYRQVLGWTELTFVKNIKRIFEYSCSEFCKPVSDTKMQSSLFSHIICRSCFTVHWNSHVQELDEYQMEIIKPNFLLHKLLVIQYLFCECLLRVIQLYNSAMAYWASWFKHLDLYSESCRFESL